MEHFVSLSSHYHDHAIPPVDQPIFREELRALIVWLTHTFVKPQSQRMLPVARYCRTPNKHCPKHGVNCPRFSPLAAI